jgi:hypothetical protein
MHFTQKMDRKDEVVCQLAKFVFFCLQYFQICRLKKMKVQNCYWNWIVLCKTSFSENLNWKW